MATAQRAWPARDVPPVFHRSRSTDLAWWLFSPLVTGTFTRVFTLGLAASLAWGLGATGLTSPGLNTCLAS